MEVLGEWGGVRVEVMAERERLAVFLEEGGEGYKLEIMFSDIISSRGCRLNGGDKSNAVLLQLKYAPRIYRKMTGATLNSKVSSVRYHFCKEDLQFIWVRESDFSASSIIGRSCYLCLELADECLSSYILNTLPFAGQLGDLFLMQGELLYSSPKLVPIISCQSDCTVPFEVLFQINSLVHMQKISSAQVTTYLFDMLSKLTLDTALEILMKMQRLESTCYKPLEFIRVSVGRRQSLSTKKVIHGDNLMSCHRVLVTPSRVYFLGPELEKWNYVVKHVVKKYSGHASDFLRVSFVDEDLSKLPPETISTRIEQNIFSKPYRTGICNRILSVLRDGISIGSKHFEFLAFSASQLRDNSVWMFASNDHVSAEHIREWMGNFSEIRSVSKCAARMGQLFSSSTQTVDVRPYDVENIEDVEITTGGIKYCFSDGIGKISQNFARQVAQKCGLSSVPSAFQIRYGGYKGVVAVDRTSFKKLSLRPSMLKFKSDNKMFNITNWSKYSPCFLNREIVTLLTTLGIDDEIFESMQREHIHLLDDMLTDRATALTVLHRMSGSEIKAAVKMLENKYEPSSEPYLLMMLKAYREHLLSEIRSRCRIFVPKGRILIGCMDEIGTLDYGQVYLRVTMTEEELQCENQPFFEKINNSSAVVVGKVVVTKNPCLHPGDIRVLQAVYDPKLDGMGSSDCLIFPRKGQRPHPNECSGGDLDGDQYFVCWDARLIPQKTDEPMDYIGRRQRLMDHKVTLEEIHKFFVDYMRNDTLGAISTAHLVHADKDPNKARSSICLQLANLHSMAVDYAKTGAPAEMPRSLKPKEFPDFMDRLDRPGYISTGVLGKLFREATSYTKTSQSSNPVVTVPLSYDCDLEVDGFEAFLEVAEELYVQYAEKLSFLMNYFEAKYEDEILTGNIRNRPMYLQKDKRRYADMKDRIIIAVKALHEEVRGWFQRSCSGDERARMASAWYHVTYHPNYNGSEPKFLSFPWILCDTLLSIKSSRAQSSRAHMMEI